MKPGRQKRLAIMVVASTIIFLFISRNQAQEDSAGEIVKTDLGARIQSEPTQPSKTVCKLLSFQRCVPEVLHNQASWDQQLRRIASC